MSLSKIMQIISACFLFFALSAHSEVPTTARVYCFYVPKNKKGAKILEKLKSMTYEKLMDNEKPDESKKVNATFNSEKRVFQIDLKLFKDLGAECQKFIGDKGEVVGLKGTDYAWPETLTYFYMFEPLGEVKWGDEGIDSGIDKLIKEASIENLPKLKLTPGNVAVLASVFNKKPEDLKEIKKTLEDKTDLIQIAQKEKNTSNMNYVNSALGVAAFLASVWLGPALIGYGTELLYPFVYHALFGIPSPFNPTYLMVYLPGKAHAVNWATQNSAAIIKSLGVLLSLGQAGYSWLKGTPEDLEKNLQDIKNKLQEIK